MTVLMPLARLAGLAAISLSLGAAGSLVVGAAPERQEPRPAPTPVDEGPSVIGRLVRYDAGPGTMTVTPEGSRDEMVIVVGPDVEVCLGARCYPPSELARLTGRRVKVRYRVDEGRAIARLVTVERRRGR
jgi:hypothetical protein